MDSETSPSKFLFRFLRILDVKTSIGLCIFVLQRCYQCGLDCREKSDLSRLSIATKQITTTRTK